MRRRVGKCASSTLLGGVYHVDVTIEQACELPQMARSLRQLVVGTLRTPPIWCPHRQNGPLRPLSPTVCHPELVHPSRRLYNPPSLTRTDLSIPHHPRRRRSWSKPTPSPSFLSSTLSLRPATSHLPAAPPLPSGRPSPSLPTTLGQKPSTRSRDPTSWTVSVYAQLLTARLPTPRLTASRMSSARSA